MKFTRLLNRIAEALDQKGWSEPAAEKAATVTASSIQNLKGGSVPGIVKFAKIVTALDIPIAEAVDLFLQDSEVPLSVIRDGAPSGFDPTMLRRVIVMIEEWQIAEEEPLDPEWKAEFIFRAYDVAKVKGDDWEKFDPKEYPNVFPLKRL